LLHGVHSREPPDRLIEIDWARAFLGAGQQASQFFGECKQAALQHTDLVFCECFGHGLEKSTLSQLR
jgi:hypothetical protein